MRQKDPAFGVSRRGAVGAGVRAGNKGGTVLAPAGHRENPGTCRLRCAVFIHSSRFTDFSYKGISSPDASALAGLKRNLDGPPLVKADFSGEEQISKPLSQVKFPFCRNPNLISKRALRPCLAPPEGHLRASLRPSAASNSFGLIGDRRLPTHSGLPLLRHFQCCVMMACWLVRSPTKV